MSSSAFKNWINPDVVRLIADELYLAYPQFNKEQFVDFCLPLESLELKARVIKLAFALEKSLQLPYPKAIKILEKVIKNNNLSGFSLWPFSEYISRNGLNHFDLSLNCMYLLTQKFTSEFCVRPFFAKDPRYVLNHFLSMTQDKNQHVRRWVSEGSRPLLPWGQKLHFFIENPTQTLPLLEALKYDEELYVRKSVANHLNDISKNHPELVVKTLKTWEQDCPAQHVEKIKWIKRHALRTLIKKGNTKALSLMGVSSQVKVKLSRFVINKKDIRLGDDLVFKFQLQNEKNKTQKLIIDYVIYFKKNNGNNVPKVFKLKTVSLKAKESISITKKHTVKKITTMRFYSGDHKLALQLNGKIIKSQTFKIHIRPAHKTQA